jgi:hypothetical protein
MATAADGHTADNGTYGINEAYDELQPRLTIGKRRTLTIEQTRKVNTFSKDIPLVVGLKLNDIIYDGYDFNKDLVNREQPYLEVSYAITSDQAGTDVIDLSQGMLVYYGNSQTPLTKTNTGQILFMKDQHTADPAYEYYNMEEHNTDGQLTTATNISLTLDFSQALNFNFEAGKTYWMKVSLYRATEEELDYPLNGKPIQTLMIPIRVETDLRYGYRIDTERERLNVNLIDKDEDDNIAELTFVSKFSHVADKSEKTNIQYSLYKKNALGKYILCTDEETQGLALRLTYDSEYELQEELSGGRAQFSLWYYNNLSGTDTAFYTNGSEPDVIIGDVTVNIAEGRISTISIIKDEAPVNGFNTLIADIIADNGVAGILRPLTLEEAAVVAAIGRILGSIRSGITTDGAGSCTMAITDFSDNLELGNYKLVGSLRVNGAEVASDFFIFNVNKNRKYAPIKP